jgi:4-amino-4-deoxy-L-arabinose transferase-like glycosyltransferase
LKTRAPDAVAAGHAGAIPALSQPSRAWPRACKLLLIPVFFVQLIPFLTVARHRLIDGDEGFYLMASRLVFEHKVPYRDFFFTQMPLLPYVYGLWMQIAGRSWVSARIFSGILTALLGTILFAFICRETRKPAAGLLAVVLFTSSTLVFAWFTIVKTFALAAIFLLLAFLLMHLSAAAPKRSAVAISGVLLGLGMDVRLYLAGLVPLFLWWILRESQSGARLRGVIWFTVGFAVAVLPNLYFLLLAPEAYLFDNLLFHAIRSDAGLVGGYTQKIFALVQVCVLAGPGNGLQMTMLLAFIFVLTVRLKVASAASRRAVQLAVALGVISLFPTPSYVQYFCLCVPFLIVASVCSASELLDRLKQPARRLAAAGGIALVALFVAASAGDYKRFLNTGDGVNGIRGQQLAPNWRIDAVRAVSRAIDELTVPGECVMSLWPGYIFESNAVPFPGLENNTGRERAGVLTSSQLAHYHILPQEQIDRELSHHGPRLVVVGNQESMFIHADPYTAMLARYGYRMVRRIGDTSIWSAPR